MNDPDPTMPLSTPAAVILMAIQSAAQRVRRSQRLLEYEELPARGIGDDAMRTAKATVELETLTILAEQFIGRFPEIGITRDRLNDALTSREPAAFFDVD